MPVDGVIPTVNGKPDNSGFGIPKPGAFRDKPGINRGNQTPMLPSRPAAAAVPTPIAVDPAPVQVLPKSSVRFEVAGCGLFTVPCEWAGPAESPNWFVIVSQAGTSPAFLPSFGEGAPNIAAQVQGSDAAYLLAPHAPIYFEYHGKRFTAFAVRDKTTVPVDEQASEGPRPVLTRPTSALYEMLDEKPTGPPPKPKINKDVAIELPDSDGSGSSRLDAILAGT